MNRTHIAATGWSPRAARPARTFAAICGALAAAYMMRTALGNMEPKDFSYFWITGQIWLEGGNPYAASFSETANAIAAGNPDMGGLGDFHRWLYAPHIWAVSSGVGLLDYVTARILWGVTGTIAILWGCYLALSAVLWSRTPMFFFLFGSLALLAGGTLGTAMTLSTGQFAPFTFLAVTGFAYGVLRQAPVAIVLALTVLTMKPSFAMPFLGFALVLPATRGPLGVAALVSLSLSVPVLLTAPLPDLVSDYLDGLSAYGGYDANAPDALTGLANLAHAGAGITLSGVVYAMIGAAAGALLAWHARKRGSGPETMAALLAVACFFVPLHLYDMTFVVLFAVFWPWPWWGALALLANLLMFRVNRLGALAGLNDPDTRFPGSFPASLLLVVLLVAALWLALSRAGKARTEGRA
jgi:hypothetical protein